MRPNTPTFASAALALALAFASPAPASVIRMDQTPIATAEERQTLSQSTRTMFASSGDLPALEKLLRGFAPEVLDSIGTSTMYSFSDPTRQAAMNALLDWRSLDFIEEAMARGSDDAAYWAMRMLSWQASNSGKERARFGRLTGPERLSACSGLVDESFLRRLIPVLAKLRDAKTARTTGCARDLIKRWGLLMDRDEFLASIQQNDEAAVNTALSQMLEHVRVDPLLTPEIWKLLAGAKTDSLKTTCLRYPWLYVLPEWDQEHAELLTRFAQHENNGPGLNVHSSLVMLAHSSNPLQKQIFDSLAKSRHPLVRERLALYWKLARAKQASLRRE